MASDSKPRPRNAIENRVRDMEVVLGISPGTGNTSSLSTGNVTSTDTIDANDVIIGGSFIPNLPTTDPHNEGQAWMNTGVFTISSG